MFVIMKAIFVIIRLSLLFIGTFKNDESTVCGNEKITVFN